MMSTVRSPRETGQRIMLSDFAEFGDWEMLLRMSLRMGVAVILGGILGRQRESAGKDAGMRTYMMVALAGAFVVAAARHEEFDSADMSRVVAGLLTGIGFLGAGSILKLGGQHEVHGLTTAAGLWLTTGIGIAAGLGHLGFATVATVLAFAILALLSHFDVSQGSHDEIAG